MSNTTVIQDLCIGYECRAAQAPGAERGRCDCPCHEMTPEEIDHFLVLATGQASEAIRGSASA